MEYPTANGLVAIVPREASCPSPPLEIFNSQFSIGNFEKPQKVIVSREEALRWDPREFLIQQKFDGVLAEAVVRIQKSEVRILGEYVVPKSGGFFTAREREMFSNAERSGRHASGFVAFTVASIDGQNLLRESNRVRWEEIRKLKIENSQLKSCNCPIVLAAPVLPQFIPALMGDGAEGVVAHRWEDAWGVMECAKVLGTWECRVTETGYTQSVGIADAATGQPRGRVKLGGGKCDRVRVGSVIKVEGMGLTEKGFIREPRPCADTATSWLVRR